MARLVSTAAPVPPPSPERRYEPDDGMEFSTVEVRQTRTTMVVIEHPTAWTDEQLQAAAGRRAGDIAGRGSYYDAETRHELVEVVRGEDSPDEAEDSYRPEPFGLTDADLEPVALPPVVSGGNDDEA